MKGRTGNRNRPRSFQLSGVYEVQGYVRRACLTGFDPELSFKARERAEFLTVDVSRRMLD